jgi:hypothetical protein
MGDHEFEPNMEGRRAPRWAVVLVIVLLFALAASWPFVIAPYFAPLGRLLSKVAPVGEVVQSSTSPDGTWTARVEYVNPGAMASASYHVLIHSRPDSTDTQVLVTAADQPLVLSWVDNTTLSVSGLRFDATTGRFLGGSR